MKYIFTFIYIIIVLFRLLAGALMFYNPIIGWIASYLADSLDYLFSFPSTISFNTYQSIDKLLDIYFRVFMVFPAFINDWEFKYVYLGLFCFRLIGDFVFFITRKEEFFFIYPNVLEFFFIGYEIQKRFEILNFGKNENLLIVLIISTVLKLVQEYFGHLAKVFRSKSFNSSSNSEYF